MDTEKEILPMYLYKRPENGMFYFRRPIPPQLKGRIKTVDFQHSLDTKSRKEALKAFPISLARSNEILERALAELSPTPEPIAGRKVPPRPIGPLVKPPRTSKPHKSLADFTESQITKLVLQWFDQRMATAEKGYRLIFSMWNESQKMDEL